LRHALKTLALTVPMNSRVRSTPLDTLWDARATVKSIPTQPTHRAVARDLIALRTPARILECLIIPTSSRTAPMHMRMHTTNRAGLRFGLARPRPMQIIRSPSVPESSTHRSIFVWKERMQRSMFSFCVYSGDGCLERTIALHQVLNLGKTLKLLSSLGFHPTDEEPQRIACKCIF